MTEGFDAGQLALELRSLLSDAEALLRASTGADAAQLQERGFELELSCVSVLVRHARSGISVGAGLLTEIRIGPRRGFAAVRYPT